MRRFLIRSNEPNSFQEAFLSSLTPELDGSSGKFRAPKKYMAGSAARGMERDLY